MPSPFPGMDPYLEKSGHWPDFHSKLINVCQELILQALPLSYDARVQEDVPDVQVSHDPKRPHSSQREYLVRSVPS